MNYSAIKSGEDGASILGLRPEMVLAHFIIQQVFAEHGYNCILTSGVGGKHKEHSHHKKGLAEDFRIWHVQTYPERESIAKDCQERLGDEFQVVLSDACLHVEFDPK